MHETMRETVTFPENRSSDYLFYSLFSSSFSFDERSSWMRENRTLDEEERQEEAMKTATKQQKTRRRESKVGQGITSCLSLPDGKTKSHHSTFTAVSVSSWDSEITLTRLSEGIKNVYQACSCDLAFLSSCLERGKAKEGMKMKEVGKEEGEWEEAKNIFPSLFSEGSKDKLLRSDICSLSPRTGGWDDEWPFIPSLYAWERKKWMSIVVVIISSLPTPLFIILTFRISIILFFSSSLLHFLLPLTATDGLFENMMWRKRTDKSWRSHNSS